MNQDFILDVSPGLARRLVEISRVCKLVLDPALIERAKDDLLPETVFSAACPDTPLRRGAMQWMLDCNFRCAVPGTLADELDRNTVIHALMAAGVDKLTIASNHYGLDWRQMLRKTPLSKVTRVSDVRSLFDDENQQDRRDGVLILEWVTGHNDGVNIDLMTALCREFPRTIIYTDPSAPAVPVQMGFHWVQQRQRRIGQQPACAWWEMGSALFPDMPNGIFDLSIEAFNKDVVYRGVWNLEFQEQVSLLYNVFLPHCLQNYGQTTA